VDSRVFSQRLVLRGVEPEDLALISKWSLSAKANGLYLSPEELTLGECQEKHANGCFWNEHSRTFMIAQKEGEAIGTIRYWIRPNGQSIAVVCVKIALVEHRGRGFGTEAQRALTNYLFSTKRCDAVEMFTDIDNMAEQRCLKKLGFVLFESLTYDDHGRSRQGHRYRLTRERYGGLPEYRFTQ
jgi:RimJ/RimL family protein N-acetyltransferase